MIDTTDYPRDLVGYGQSVPLAAWPGGARIAVQIVIATTLLSFITLPWIITWGCQWIGLKPLLP